MLPIQKIIAPTDFSEPAQAGVDAAEELAREFSAEIILVYAVPRIPMVPAPHGAGAVNQIELEQEIRESAEKALGEIAEKLRAGIGRVRYRVLSGDAAHQIAEAAKQEQAELIVISTHGETGWRRFVSGSVAEKVVRLAECPVLAVHGPAGKED